MRAATEASTSLTSVLDVQPRWSQKKRTPQVQSAHLQTAQCLQHLPHRDVLTSRASHCWRLRGSIPCRRPCLCHRQLPGGMRQRCQCRHLNQVFCRQLREVSAQRCHLAGCSRVAASHTQLASQAQRSHRLNWQQDWPGPAALGAAGQVEGVSVAACSTAVDSHRAAAAVERGSRIGERRHACGARLQGQWG